MDLSEVLLGIHKLSIYPLAVTVDFSVILQSVQQHFSQVDLRFCSESPDCCSWRTQLSLYCYWYKSCAHMAEETRDARTSAPWGIAATVLCIATFGLVFNLGILCNSRYHSF